MAIRLKIVSEQSRTLGPGSVKEFGAEGGRIGRSLDCDWVLPDGQRYVSSRHASIDYRSGSYYIIDTSTNGVYVNDAQHAVGRGKPQRLFNGDRIRIGEYRMLVEIDETAQEALTDERHVDPVDLAQRVEAPEPTETDLVDAFEITGVGIEMTLTDDELETLVPPKTSGLTLVLEADRPARAEKAKPHDKPPGRGPQSVSSPSVAQQVEPSRPAAPVSGSAAGKHQARGTAPPRPPAGPARSPAKAPPAGGSAAVIGPVTSSNALAALLRGAGISARRVPPQQTEEVLQRAGRLIRAMAVGLSESLHHRDEQRAALKLPPAPPSGGGNPLTPGGNVQEVLERLLLGDGKRPQPPDEAVREAFDELRQHQRLMLKALRGALDRFVSRLDPEQLEQKFARGGVRRLMSAANKLKYWDLYRDLYDVVAHHPPDELPMQFIDDFVEAYEQALERSSEQSPQGPAIKLEAG